MRQTESPSLGTPLVLIAVTTPNPQEKDFHVALSPWKDIHLYPTMENVLFLCFPSGSHKPDRWGFMVFSDSPSLNFSPHVKV